MADTAQEQLKSLEQRLAQNPQSPLFVRLAAYYVLNGRAKEALRLCDDGLAHYPFYSTAHLIKGKALVELGMMAEARHEYDVVHELLPMNEAVAKLCASIDLGPSQNLEAAPVAEEVIEAEPDALVAVEAPAEQPAIGEPEVVTAEEPAVQEAAATTEPGFGTEEAPAQEPVAQEPQIAEQAGVVTPADDSFGFGGTQVAEPQPEEPGAGEKLGLEEQPEAQQPSEDFGFGVGAQAPQAPADDEGGFGAQQAEVTEQPQEAPAVEPSAMEAAPRAAEPTSTPAEPAADWYEAFSQLQQPAEEAPAAASAAPQAEEENPFAMFGAEEPAATLEGEPYEDFTARVRMELFGTEDTMTLEEYLGQTAPPPPPATAEDNIGELAEKLKSSQRMKPPVINFSEKTPRSAGDADPAGATGFVTPTLAEIYVKQGWFDDAIKAYRALATNKPAESAKFQQRIAEIEEMKKKV